MRRQVTAIVGGAVVVLCAGAAAWSAMVAGHTVHVDGTQLGWRYSPMTWGLLLALVGAGTVMTSGGPWSRPAAVVAAILGFQVSVRALVMARSWFHVHGTTGVAPDQLAAVVTYAALVAVLATAATVAALAVVWRAPGGWSSAVPSRPGLAAMGVAVGLLLPVVWSAAHDNRITVSAGMIAMYALPWGAGVAAMGWLRGRTAIAAGATVVACLILYAVIVLGDHALTYLTPPPPESD
ncbi:hypothetical protein [Actinoplanes sp. NPDC051859]|uniref:hypothetical protein n=1 Tax=Actinoplanes sp. NPDC051859 TaxID=3363909 RepID=UPI003793E5E2